jgi:nucleotide-binding universal stress UspA family protein
MKTVLVPCDFSQTALNAFSFALDVAERSEAVIHLVHVIDVPTVYDAAFVPAMPVDTTVYNDLEAKAGEEFRKIIDKHRSSGIHMEAKLAYGSPEKVLLDYIQTAGIDVVIMGSHGARGLRELLIGSTAEKIIRHATVPVMVIKDTFLGSVRNIAFPNTLEPTLQEDLVSNVKALQEFFQATLHLVYINTPANFLDDSVTYDRLNRFVQQHHLTNYTLNVYNHADVEEGIHQFVRETGAELIAMGTHGRTGLAHFVHGSLAEAVANHTDRIIWTYTLQHHDQAENTP